MPHLNDAEHNVYRLSLEHTLGNGSLYDWSDDFVITQGASVTYSWTTGVDPFLLLLANVSFAAGGHDELGVNGYVGGTVSGVTEISEVFPRNHYQPGKSPYLVGSVFQNRTIDVAGVKFLGGNISDSGGSIGDGGFLLNPDTLYYITITNLGNQTADGTIVLLAGAPR